MAADKERLFAALTVLSKLYKGASDLENTMQKFGKPWLDNLILREVRDSQFKI